jgi:hypothetical protein
VIQRAKKAKKAQVGLSVLSFFAQNGPESGKNRINLPKKRIPHVTPNV